MTAEKSIATAIRTHDGNYIVTDRDGASASGPSKAEAFRRLREQKARDLS